MLRCAALLFLLITTGAGAAAAAEEPPYLDFVVGPYQMVGQHPDGGATYAGQARIERHGDGLRLTRRIGKQTQYITGSVRRADPGEAWVLSFAWVEGAKQKMEMVCLIGNDLDNFARLSCHWGEAKNPHRFPGMEAYFAMQPWIRSDR
jgi:hypothetical protein